MAALMLTEAHATGVLSTPFVPGEDGYAFYRIPSLVVARNGDLLAFAEGRKNGAGDAGDIDVVMRRSTDGGVSWQPMSVVWDDGENTCGNPVPVVLESGRVVLVMCRNNQTNTRDRSVHATYSDNDGKTWSEVTDITPQVKQEGENWYATGPCHGIVKTHEPNKGRIIIPANRTRDSYLGAVDHSHIIYSDDQGASWYRGGFSDFKYGNESTVVELANGDLLLNMRNASKTDFYRADALSKDGGLSFLPHRKTALIEPVMGCQGSLLRYDEDVESGQTTLLFSNPNHETSRRHGTLKVSMDSGDTWTKQYRYVPESGDSMYTAYSDIAIVAPGVIGVLYETGYKYSWGIFFKTVRFSDITQDLK